MNVFKKTFKAFDLKIFCLKILALIFWMYTGINEENKPNLLSVNRHDSACKEILTASKI